MPLPPAAPVQGRPLSIWLQRFVLSHQPGPQGWRRLAWPDGAPLLAQSWPEVLIAHVLRDELDAVAAERHRETLRAARAGR